MKPADSEIKLTLYFTVKRDSSGCKESKDLVDEVGDTWIMSTSAAEGLGRPNDSITAPLKIDEA